MGSTHDTLLCCHAPCGRAASLLLALNSIQIWTIPGFLGIPMTCCCASVVLLLFVALHGCQKPNLLCFSIHFPCFLHVADTAFCTSNHRLCSWPPEYIRPRPLLYIIITSVPESTRGSGLIGSLSLFGSPPHRSHHLKVVDVDARAKSSAAACCSEVQRSRAVGTKPLLR